MAFASWQRYCTEQWASAKLCGVEQRAPPMFGRAAITLGIGPHSSYILNAVRCPYVYVRSSVMLGVASSISNDVIMRIAGLVAGCEGRRREPREWHHNENDVTVITAVRRYGDWRHVATGCNALVLLKDNVVIHNSNPLNGLLLLGLTRLTRSSRVSRFTHLHHFFVAIIQQL